MKKDKLQNIQYNIYCKFQKKKKKCNPNRFKDSKFSSNIRKGMNRGSSRSGYRKELREGPSIVFLIYYLS